MKANASQFAYSLPTCIRQHRRLDFMSDRDHISPRDPIHRRPCMHTLCAAFSRSLLREVEPSSWRMAINTALKTCRSPLRAETVLHVQAGLIQSSSASHVWPGHMHECQCKCK